MKRLLIYLALIFSMAVFAQQQTDTGEEPSTESGNDSEEASVTDDAESPDQTESEGDALPGSVDTADESEAEPEATEVTDIVETEFDPDEEISEDYPVPLPSDI